MLIKFYGYGFFGYWRIPLNYFDGALVFLIIVELILTSSTNVTDDLLASSNDQVGVGVARISASSSSSASSACCASSVCSRA